MTKNKVGRIADRLIEIEKAWIHAPLAFVMVDAFIEERHEVPESIAARMGVSGESVRRWLNELVARGLVVMDIIHGRRHYRTTEAHARSLWAIVDSVDDDQTSEVAPF